MLEAMQERRVTVVGKTFTLEAPFLVLATQNPVEQEGTYPLPEAQLDRFMFLIELDYPTEEEEIRIARTTTGEELAELNHLLHAEDIIRFQHLVRHIPVPDHIYSFAAKLVRRTRPNDPTAPAWIKPLVSWGAGPRAVQYLILGAKARAALLGSYMVRLEDIESVAEPVIAHRLVTTFAAQAEGIAAKEIVRRCCRKRSRRPNAGYARNHIRAAIEARYCKLQIANCKLTRTPTRLRSMSETSNPRSFLDPRVLSRLANVPLFARRPMQGSVSGRHTSPHRGASVEFAEYRKYVPGDDLRRLDWRVYGRSDRFYVKEFEADTNLRCCLVLDTSGSMGFGSEGTTKIDFARKLAGSLGYLAVQQGDAAGISCVAEGIVLSLPPTRNPAHLPSFFDILERAKPAAKPICRPCCTNSRRRSGNEP